MSILRGWFSGSKETAPAERPAIDYSIPRNAADLLLAWSQQIAANRLVDKAERDRLINCPSLRAYKPAGQIAPDELSAASPERQLICHALQEISEQGKLSDNMLATLNNLGAKGVLAAPGAQGLDYVR